MAIGLMDFVSVGIFLLIAVDLCLAQWSGFKQSQAPIRFQQQQSTVLAPQQAVQSLQTSASFSPSRPLMSPTWVDPRKLQEPGST